MANPNNRHSTCVGDGDEYLDALVESAGAALRGEAVDEKMVSVLREAGAAECWHKHGSFLDHLIGVHRILTMWNAPVPVRLCGLFHSAYSNSYVNLAIFPPSEDGRETVRAHVGPAAERLIHLFCIVPRQQLIHDYLMSRYADDAELVRLLLHSDGDDSWRAKVQSVCPAEGIKVKHIRTGEDVVVPRRVVAVFLLLTMADFSDQLFGFQDNLFNNTDGRLDFLGNNALKCLWPGDGKPGLWLNYVSRMAAIYSLIVREEEMTKSNNTGDEYGDLELVIPPVFNWCKAVIDSEDQMIARDLYWEALCNAGIGLERAEDMLLASVDKNPFVGEPLLVLGQIYLGKGEFQAAEKAVHKGLTLMLQWGSPWDKRMTWQGWVAWGRVLLIKAKDKSWPQNGWGILNLGLVT